MTAFQPDPDKVPAQESLGGLRPELTSEYIEAIGADALRIVSPRHAARADASGYYRQEFGLSGVATDMTEETRAAMIATHQGLRDKTLPGMANDPSRIINPVETPEEAGARIQRQAYESWPEPDEANEDGRLF